LHRENPGQQLIAEVTARGGGAGATAVRHLRADELVILLGVRASSRSRHRSAASCAPGRRVLRRRDRGFTMRAAGRYGPPRYDDDHGARDTRGDRGGQARWRGELARMSIYLVYSSVRARGDLATRYSQLCAAVTVRHLRCH
jgi:hypothetical protein